MRLLMPAALIAATLLAAAPAMAQTAPATGDAATGNEPSQTQLDLAHTLLGKMGNNPDATLQALRAPMVGLMRQMGITQQDRAEALVNEAVFPLLHEHIADYLDLRARDYAAALTADDLRSAIAFYDSPAGQDLIRAEPQLARSRLAGLSQWIGELRPEMTTRIQQVMLEHGWDKKPAP